MPVRLYLLVATLIASIAFGIAQLVPGAGMPFAILASLLWTAWSAHRERRHG